MNVIRLEVGPMQSNAYVVVTGGGAAPRPGLVIDPGEEGARIAEQCRREGVAPCCIINTHGHADHMAANAALKAAFPTADLCVGEQDAWRLPDPLGNLSALFGEAISSPSADRLLCDGDTVECGGATFRVLTTPGHTPGSICLLEEGRAPANLFAGDLLFRDGIGRYDLPGGDPDALLESLRRVMSLPDETLVWPGHGEATTIGRERSLNPFLVSTMARS